MNMHILPVHKQWECGQKKGRWNTYYKMLNCSGKKQPAKIQTEMSVP